MKRDEVLSWLEEVENPVIAFDTNALFGNRSNTRFEDLCDTLNRIDLVRAPRMIRKVLSAAVYMEKVQDLRQEYGEKYDHSLPKWFLDAKKVEVLAFAPEDAEHTARLLGQRYPSSHAWRDFKRAQCLDCLGLQNNAVPAQGTGKGCGATIDWLVAGHADARGYLLVTSDRGPEFQGMAWRSTLEEVYAAASELLARLSSTTSNSSST